MIYSFVFLSGFFVSIATAQDIYFQRDSTIIRWMPVSKSIETIWAAPFDIFDVTVSRDGSFLCFTRWENAEGEDKGYHDPKREVGFYSVAENKITIIKSSAHYNFGAVISPNNNLIAFNYLIQPGDWETAVYDRSRDRVAYDVDSLSVFGWRSDSLLLFATFDGVVQENLFNHSRRIVPIPDTTMMDVAIPGTEMFFVNDSLYFSMCEDMVVSNPDFDGPPENAFITRNGKTSRLLNGIVNVNACILSDGNLYVDFTDYSKSRKGVHKLIVYDSKSGKQSSLKPLGSLVGVKEK